MKICACITEYNPFHLGHLKHLEYIKKTLGAEKLIVIMSGNFCQRGEPAILNKFTRAKHAILAGADVVIELPTVFATANAEVFAKGGVKVINGLNVVDGLCFGVESGKKQEYVMGKAKTGISGFIGRQKANMETHKNTVNNLFGKFKK